MNIRTQKIEALLSQQELQTQKTAATKNGSLAGFAETFAEQAALGGADAQRQQGASTVGVQTSVVQQMLVQNAEKFAASDTAGSTESVLSKASGTLDMWESYADTLRKPTGEGNLREAYSLLEGIESQVSALKSDAHKQTLAQNPELANLVNELEIMSVTEKIKFNRGDYIA